MNNTHANVAWMTDHRLTLTHMRHAMETANQARNYCGYDAIKENVYCSWTAKLPNEKTRTTNFLVHLKLLFAFFCRWIVFIVSNLSLFLHFKMCFLLFGEDDCWLSMACGHVVAVACLLACTPSQPRQLDQFYLFVYLSIYAITLTITIKFFRQRFPECCRCEFFFFCCAFRLFFYASFLIFCRHFIVVVIFIDVESDWVEGIRRFHLIVRARSRSVVWKSCVRSFFAFHWNAFLSRVNL